MSDSSHKKMSRDNALRALLASASEKLSLQQRESGRESVSSPPPHSSLVSSAFWSLCGQQLQSMALDSGVRYVACLLLVCVCVCVCVCVSDVHVCAH